MCLKCWMLSCVCCVCLFTGGPGSLLHSFIQFWVRFSVQIQIYPSYSQRSATVLQLQIPNFSFLTQLHKQETNNPWIHIAHFHIVSSLEAQVGQDKDTGRGITQPFTDHLAWVEFWAVLVHSLPIQHCTATHWCGCWNLLVCWVCQCRVQGYRVYSITPPSWVNENENVVNWVMNIKIKYILANK